MSETPTTAEPSQDWPTDRHILRAIRSVMDDVRAVGKHGQMNAGAGGRYTYRKYDDLQRELGDAFRDHGVFVQMETLAVDYATHEVPKDRGGTVLWTTCRISKRYHFTSLVDGSVLTVEGAGEGRDSADKSTSKAEVMAIKYALSNAFMISVDEGKDPDSERPQVERPARIQARQDGYHAAAPDWVDQDVPRSAEHAAGTGRPPAPQPPPADPRTDPAALLRFIRTADTLEKWTACRDWARQGGNLDAVVDGLPIRTHLLAQAGTLTTPERAQELMTQ